MKRLLLLIVTPLFLAACNGGTIGTNPTVYDGDRMAANYKACMGLAIEANKNTDQDSKQAPSTMMEWCDNISKRQSAITEPTCSIAINDKAF